MLSSGKPDFRMSAAWTNEPGWQTEGDVDTRMEMVASVACAAVRDQLGERPVVLVMVATNDGPHSRHLVAWWGSCLEVRGLLAQGSDVVLERFHGVGDQREEFLEAAAALGSWD